MMQIISPFKDPFKKPKPTAIEEYAKTGKFQEGIPEMKIDEVPKDGDFRIHKNTIYKWSQANQGYDEYTKTMQIDEVPEDGAIRLHGNRFYKYVAADKGYQVASELPRTFIHAKERKKTPFNDIVGYFKEMIKNVPKSTYHAAEGMLRFADPTSPNWLLLDSQKGKTPEEGLFPQTMEAAKAGSAPMAAKGLGHDVINLATIPFQLAKQVVTDPVGTFRDDPMAAVFGVGVLRGGIKAGMNMVAKSSAKGRLTGGEYRNLIENINPSSVERFGVNLDSVLKQIDEGIPREARAKLGVKSEIPKHVDTAAKMTTAKGHPALQAITKEGGIGKPLPVQPKWDSILGKYEPRTPQKPPRIGKKLPEQPKYDPKTGEYVTKPVEMSDAQFEKMQKQREVDTEASFKTHPPKEGSSIPKTLRELKLKDIKQETRVSDPFVRGKEYIEPGTKPIKVDKTEAQLEKTKKAIKGEPGGSFHSGIPVGDLIDKVINLSRDSELGRQVIRKIGNRSVRLLQGKIEGQRTINEVTKGLSQSEMDAMTFVRAGVEPTALKGTPYEHLTEIVSKPSLRLKSATERIGKVFDKDFDFLEKYHDNIQFEENYVSQIWDISKKQKSYYMNRFTQTNPFSKRRKIPTLEEGLKEGLKLKVHNIREIYEIYNDYKHKVSANIDLVDSLSSMRTETGNAIITTKPTTVKGMDPYVRMEHPAFGGKGVAYAHPDIYNELKVVFGRSEKGSVARALSTINAIAKSTQLSLSLFHHGALSEAGLGMTGAKGVAKTWGRSVRDLMKGKKPWILSEEARKFTDDAVESGVNIGATPDIQVGLIEKGLKKLVNAMPEGKGAFTRIFGSKSVAKGVERGVSGWNKGLWDHLHNTLKVIGYHDSVAATLKSMSKRYLKKYDRDLTPAEIVTAKKQVAQYINDSYGGQNWDTLGIGKVKLGDPKFQQGIRYLLLAPDWTISVFRQASALIRGPYKKALGKEMIKTGQARQGKTMLAEGEALTATSRRFWRRMMTYAFVITQSANMTGSTLFSKDKKPRFTWQNSPGHEGHILIGRGEVGKDIKGERELYARPFKQAGEPVRWLTEPWQIFGSKISPVGRAAVRQLSAHEPGSGWPTEFASDVEDKKFSLGKRVADFATMFIPFSLKQSISKRGPGQFLLMFPVSKGLSERQATDEYRKALGISDEKKRKAAVNRVTMAAAENNIPWEKAYNSAQSLERSQEKFDDYDFVEGIKKDLRKLDTVEDKINYLYAGEQRGSFKPSHVRSVLQDMKEKQEVNIRIKQLKQEESYIKRLAGDKHIGSMKAKYKIADKYDSMRNSVIMLFREGKRKEGIKLAQDWNKEMDKQLTDLALAMGVRPDSLRGSQIHKNYRMSAEKMRGLMRKAKDLKVTSVLERQVGQEIK